MNPWRAVTLLALVALALSIPATPATSQEVDPDEGDGGADEVANTVSPAAGSSAAQRKRWLAARVEELVGERDQLANARIGILVSDLGSGKTIYERDSGGAYNVASNTKVATAAAALARLGPGFRFETTLHGDAITGDGAIPGDLYVRGRGDPALGTDTLRAIADELVSLGVSKISGGIIIDDSYFDGVTDPPHFADQPKEQAAFRAPVSALSLNFNRVAVEVTPAPSGVGAARIRVDPPNDYAVLIGSVDTIDSGRTRVKLSSKVVKEHLELTLSGQIRANSAPRRYKRRVASPLRYFGATLRALLVDRGIAVGSRRIRRGEVPAKLPALVTHRSQDLAELVRGLGKYSNNYVAEMLLKTVGAEVTAAGRPATWADGVAAVSAYLTEQVGLEPGSFRYDNGSGLYDSSQFTPSQMVAILAAGYRDFHYGPDLLASLSIAGVDGTLRRRMSDSAATGLVRAKTGTLATVSTLTGYAAVDGRRRLAFAIFVNDLPRKGKAKRQARSLQDQIADALISYLGDNASAAK